MPPSISEILIAAINRVFKISIANIVILSKFFLPALLFLLVYFLIRQLTNNAKSISNPEGSRQSGTYGAKINAIGGGLLVVLGYDLIDYGTLINYLRGLSVPENFLLWTRPINPILGGLLIYCFLLLVWRLFKSKDAEHSYIPIFLAGLVLSLAITSYFFSWGIILSLAGVLIMAGLLKSRYRFVKKLIFIILIALTLSLPYFYSVFTAIKNPSYQEVALRTGLFLNHQPILNKFLIFSLLIFIILTLLKRENIKKDWWLFSFSFILAGFIAFNQQIITGRTIWPFHFVQYTIPLAITALFVIFGNMAGAGKKLFYPWLAVLIFIIISSLSFGIYVQALTYKQSYQNYKEKQKYADVFAWLNKNAAKDSVILSENDNFLGGAILAYTHCNVYLSGFTLFLMPFERIYHNYFVYLRMEGIGGDEIADYLDKNSAEAAAYLYGASGMYYGSRLPAFAEIRDKLITSYKNFLKSDFKNELRRYKLDYIITVGNLSDEIKNLLRGLNPLYSSDNNSIYQFK